MTFMALLTLWIYFIRTTTEYIEFVEIVTNKGMLLTVFESRHFCYAKFLESKNNTLHMLLLVDFRT